VTVSISLMLYLLSVSKVYLGEFRFYNSVGTLHTPGGAALAVFSDQILPYMLVKMIWFSRFLLISNLSEAFHGVVL
jgi:uncharacterized membrane protein